MSVTVVEKKGNERYQVYDITYDRSGFPRFLIYRDNQWVRVSAKYFRPFSIDDIGDSIMNTKEFEPLRIF